MNRLIIIFINRIYILLKMVGNQSPFWGAIILSTVIINLFAFSLITAIHIHISGAPITGSLYYCICVAVIFVAICLFGKKNEDKIKLDIINNSLFRSLCVGLVILIMLTVSIIVFNINRAIISDLNYKNKTENIGTPSLEGKIKKWWKNR